MRKASTRLLFCAALLAAAPLTPLLFAGTESLTQLRLRKSVVPRFTLDQAVLTALQRNADIQKARQEIERTKGLYIAMRAEILPKIGMTGQFQDIDPHLQVNHGSIEVTATATPSPTPGVTATPIGTSGFNFGGVERSYNVRLEATQVIFAGGRVVSQIRAANFTRDSSYYAFRNAIDFVVSTVKQQFYQVLLNRALIGVQEESVNLLKSQLQDQQNRFENRARPAPNRSHSTYHPPTYQAIPATKRTHSAA